MGGRRASRTRACACSPGAWSRSMRCSTAPSSSTSTGCCADDHGFSAQGAFDIATRVFRSGGFAKDLIYLEGLPGGDRPGRRGRSLDPFWIGKIARDHVAGDRGAAAAQPGSARRLFKPAFLQRDRRRRPDRPASRRTSLPGQLLDVERLTDADRLFRQRPRARICGLHDHGPRPPGGAARAIAVCYITPSDFVLNPDDTLSRPRPLPAEAQVQGPRASFFETLKESKAIKIEPVDVDEIDVLMLRNDPSIDARRRRGRWRPASCSGARR